MSMKTPDKPSFVVFSDAYVIVWMLPSGMMIQTREGKYFAESVRLPFSEVECDDPNLEFEFAKKNSC